MADIELRAPRRRIQKEKDQLLPILCTIVAIGIGGFLFVKNADKTNAEKNEQPHAAGTPAQNPIPRPRREHRHMPEPASPTQQPETENRITTESGKVYYLPPRKQSPQNRTEPSTADRYRMASRIMESTKAAHASKHYSYQNNTLRIANDACRAVLREGTIAYRECRAAQWRRLRDGCIRRRSAMNITTGHQLDDLREEVEEWCTAESKYQIVD